jgi:hypothetical protein
MLVQRSHPLAADYEVVTYQPDFKTQVVKLETSLWGPNLDLNRSYFEWKYEQNPYVKDPPIYLAVHNGKVVGMRGFSGVQWEAGVPAQRVTSLYSDDGVIAPEHRGGGLMSKITTSAFEDLAVKGYEYVFNLSSGLIMLRSNISKGFRSAGWAHPMHWASSGTRLQSGALRRMRRVPLMSRPLDYFASSRFLRSHRSLQDVDQNQIDRIRQNTPAIHVNDTPQCAAMAALVGRIESHGKIRHVRNREYFQWRFQNPMSRYRFLFWEVDRLEGYLVLQEYTSEVADHGVVNIVDWEASNATIQIGLLQAAFAFAKGRRLVIWSASLSPETIALLNRHGFRSDKTPRGLFPPAILVRAVRRDQLKGEWVLAGRPLLDLANWDLRMLYSMYG